MIVSAFICGAHGADDWILPHRLRSASVYSDQIYVALDRSPESVAILRQFPKVQYRHVDSDPEVCGMRADGLTYSEGRLRQTVWDWATQDSNPASVVLGDTDEIPAPSIVQLLNNLGPHADVYYADWPNLCYDVAHAIGGERSVWSYQHPASNKKGMVIRYDPRRRYVYRDGVRHVRMEPSPLNEFRAIFDAEHLLSGVPLLHYRWANWPRWQSLPETELSSFSPWPPADASIVGVPREWLWRWDADAMLAQLPEPIAVVGNGPCVGHGYEINRAATVIRFNNFITDNKYDADVGSKTTHWCTNCWHDVTPRPWTGEMFTVYTDGEQRENLDRWLGMYPHMRVPMGRSWHDAAREVKAEKPSTGLVVLARLLHHGKRPSVYGFDGLAGGHYWDPEHHHDHPPEREALAKLAGVTLR